LTVGHPPPPPTLHTSEKGRNNDNKKISPRSSDGTKNLRIREIYKKQDKTEQQK
jgi:hypothetical protein